MPQFAKNAEITFKRDHEVISPQSHQVEFFTSFLFTPPFRIHS
jgi:hypothetical protein